MVNTLPSADTNVTFYPSPGNLETYYANIHSYMLALNTLIGGVMRKPCFPASDLTLWYAFRTSWVTFYSAGPSIWFTWLKDDVSRAQAFHARALQWEAFVVGHCAVKPLPVTARPMGTPATFGDAIAGLFSSVTQGVVDGASAGLQSLSDSSKKTLYYVGGGAIALMALYLGIQIWRR